MGCCCGQLLAAWMEHAILCHCDHCVQVQVLHNEAVPCHRFPNRLPGFLVLPCSTCVADSDQCGRESLHLARCVSGRLARWVNERLKSTSAFSTARSALPEALTRQRSVGGIRIRPEDPQRQSA